MSTPTNPRSYLYVPGDRSDRMAKAAGRDAGLRAGTVNINTASGWRPDAPFGGCGASWLGREGGRWGLHPYLEPQHIVVGGDVR